MLQVGPSSFLVDMLGRAGAIDVVGATSGTDLENGRIYVAPPGFQLLVHHGHTLLRRGPRENLARPSIDPPFRSAACSHGARVIELDGVLLDMNLHGETSFAVAARLAAREIPFVFLTGFDQQAAFPSEFQSSPRLTKPVAAGSLASMMERHFVRPAASAGS